MIKCRYIKKAGAHSGLPHRGDESYYCKDLVNIIGVGINLGPDKHRDHTGQ